MRRWILATSLFTKLKYIIFVLVTMTMSLLFASTVEWNQMQSIRADDMDSGPIWQIGGGDKGIMPVIMVTLAHGVLSGSDLMGGMCTIWVRQMNEGDVVSAETMNGPGLSYFYHATEDVSGADCDGSIFTDELIYLSFSTLAWENDGQGPGRYMVYGWVAVDTNGDDVVVTGSAWDADGGAMIVGGGAIPEPSGGLLVLVGLLALILHRPQEFRSLCC